MRLTAIEEYGIRCLLRVANHQEAEPIGIPDIARLEGLSQAYAAKLMRILRQKGFVVSVRGAAGGYLLARPPSEVNLWQVLEALAGPLCPPTFCSEYAEAEGRCASPKDCSIRFIWSWMDQTLKSKLEKLTLADLIRGGRHLRDSILAIEANNKLS